MDVPIYTKPVLTRHDCAAVALQMALAYYGIRKDINEIYDMVDALEPEYNTVPWGICAAAAELGLHVSFISRNPLDLLESGYQNTVDATGKTREEVERWVKKQIQRCNNSNITLLEWAEDWRDTYGYKYEDLPRKIVKKKAGVVIPTVHLLGPHAIVLTKVTDDRVYYNDPNLNTPQSKSLQEFYDMWIHPNTDNDLTIISKEKIDLHNL